MQLELFQTPTAHRKRPPIWEQLNRTTQTNVIAILSRLMSQTMGPQAQSNSHER